MSRKVLYFGTHEREHPRNAQVISALRAAGLEVVELAPPPPWRRPRPDFDVIVVAYPGEGHLLAAKWASRGRPVVLNALDPLPEGRGRLRAFLDRRLLRAADLVVVDTEANAAFLARLARLPPERFDACFLGAEEAIFHPSWQPAAPFTCLLAGDSGRLTPLDGIETVLEAARRVPEVQFRLVGEGELQGMSLNVERVRRIDHELLGHEYRRAGCALGIFGTAARAARLIPARAFRALACGTPLVTANTPAARELLADGESALLVPQGDPDALAEAVRRLDADFELIRRLSEGGHSAYRERASEQVLGPRWRELIERQSGTASRSR